MPIPDTKSTAPATSTARPEIPPEHEILRMMSGAWVAQSMYAAARLELAEKLVSGPKSSADLAKACSVLPDRLERLLRTLAGEKVFHCLPDGRYENTPLSLAMRVDPKLGMGAAVIMNGEQQYLGWSRFLDCLRAETTAFELFYHQPIFAWFAEHPAEVRTFQQAMQAYSHIQIPALVAAFDATPFKMIIDVGGGHGGLLRGYLERATSAHGVVFDLEQSLTAARAAGLDRHDRVKLVAGDFFASVVAGGDLYLLKFILHDWDDARCVTILKNIASGLARGGKVLVAEHIVAAPNESDPAKWLDLHMMAMPGGRERTQVEYAALFDRAGLRLVRTIPTTCGLWLLEAEAAR